MKRCARMLAALSLALFLALLPLCASADGPLSADQIEYVKGELGVPRDIAVTSYECSDRSFWEAAQEWLIHVELYSNGEYLAGASLIADDLSLGRTIMGYDESVVNTSVVERQRAGEWSINDAAYLKGAFGIPWNLSVSCFVGEPYYWDGGGMWLTEVEFQANGELVASAAIEADSTTVNMVRNISTYSAY